jgi:hypothetical protein
MDTTALYLAAALLGHPIQDTTATYRPSALESLRLSNETAARARHDDEQRDLQRDLQRLQNQLNHQRLEAETARINNGWRY